jgi:hypothetical protein
LLPFLFAIVQKEKVAPKEKDFRPRFVWLETQWLKLGNAELTSTL